MAACTSHAVQELVNEEVSTSGIERTNRNHFISEMALSVHVGFILCQSRIGSCNKVGSPSLSYLAKDQEIKVQVLQTIPNYMVQSNRFQSCIYRDAVLCVEVLQ